MSIWRRAAVFVAKELVASATYEFGKEIGQHLGDALGTVLGRRIDPEHARHDDDDEEDDEDEDDEDGEV